VQPDILETLRKEMQQRKIREALRSALKTMLVWPPWLREELEQDARRDKRALGP
jgi:hypothetical protein